MRRVRLDAGLAWRTLVMTLLLIWPVILFGRPAYFDDSPAYYNGGATAFAFLEDQIWPKPAAEPGAAEDDSGTRVARSIPYSIVAYMLAAPQAQMVFLVVFQAALVAFVTVVFLFAAGARDGPRFWGGAAMLAFATPAAFFASFAMPDILAGVAILVMAIFTFFVAELSIPVAVLLVLIGGFSVAAHASHLALAAALLPLVLIWSIWRQRRAGARFSLRPFGWLAALVALGWAVVLLSGYIGFGEVTVAPKRYPLTLARSIEDGPARWYLDRHCAERRYAVCPFFDNHMPKTAKDFLWGPGGVISRATPQEMDRIRVEEKEILLRAAEAYPAEQAAGAAKGLLTQLVSFGLAETRFDHRIYVDDEGAQWETIAEADPRIRYWVEKLSQLSAALALLWLVIGFRSAPVERKALVLFILAGLLANAAVCAIFSAVADRYQARVIWLLPLVAIATCSLKSLRRDAGST